MDNFGSLIALLLGIALGALAAWLLLRTRLKYEYSRGRAESEAERAILVERLAGRDKKILEQEDGPAQERADADELRRTNTELFAAQCALQTQLEDERKSSQEKLDSFKDATRELSDRFKALSAEALRENNRSFIELAQ